ncbi:MAG: hypothetical protein NTX20_06830 [Verrucomicrobia bacterium]|nr:hypothetical protein [Verrucomicrobiota bacterium]
MDEAERQRAAERRREAVCSPFMRISRFPVEVARDLLDAGYYRVDQLAGRSPESLLTEIKARSKEKPGAHYLPALKMGVYFAETDKPDPKRLFLDQWL